jgi:hypothetical protein
MLVGNTGTRLCLVPFWLTPHLPSSSFDHLHFIVFLLSSTWKPKQRLCSCEPPNMSQSSLYILMHTLT